MKVERPNLWRKPPYGKNRKYSKHDLLENLKNIFEKTHQPLTYSSFLKHTKFSWGPYKRLGGLIEACKLAGIPFRVKGKIFDGELIDNLINIYKKINRPINHKTFKDNSKYSRKMYERFSGLMKACQILNIPYKRTRDKKYV